MAQALDRNTGRPVKSTTADDSSFAQQQVQLTGPRTDTSRVTSADRTNQAVSSFQSAINTTPTVLNILDQLVTQLFGAPAVSKEQAETQIPLLVKEIAPGIAPGTFSAGYKATTYYRDPKTGQTFSENAGTAENVRRMQQREQVVARGEIKAGTPEQQRQQDERQREIVRNRASQEEYGKEAAFADSQALVDRSIQRALEAALPQISAASEGAGTSKSSMAALLTQRAAERGATEGAALGTQTAVAYGGIQNQLAGVLELLTRSDPNSPVNQLIQAIVGSKGLVSEQTGNQVTSGTSTKTQEGTTTQGPQEVFQNTLREILQPLTQLPTLTPATTAPKDTVPAVPLNPVYAFEKDSDPAAVQTSTEASVYGSGDY